MHIYSYNFHSRGTKDLAKRLGIKRIKHEGSKFKWGDGKLILNWGATQVPPAHCKFLNDPRAVNEVSNKLSFLSLISNAEEKIHIPQWTIDKEETYKWLAKGSSVVCRQILNGSGGRGIVLADDKHEVVDAPLYTRYIKKKEEYRVHISVWDDVFDVQKKAKRHGDEVDNWRIRNHDNGFIYIREDIHPPKDVINQAVAAFCETELDFGAVDVIWNANREKAYVLEINTAPGLEGTTLDNYEKVFKKFL